MLELTRTDLGFSAAHFSVVGGVRERLHGHNYHVSLRAWGSVGDDGTLVDFGVLKEALRSECAPLDERMLVPERSDCVRISIAATEVTLLDGDTRYVLPRDDVCLLPVVNTTCECLAAHLLQAVRRRIGALPLRLELGVEELPGQGAVAAE